MLVFTSWLESDSSSIAKSIKIGLHLFSIFPLLSLQFLFWDLLRSLEYLEGCLAFLASIGAFMSFILSKPDRSCGFRWNLCSFSWSEYKCLCLVSKNNSKDYVNFNTSVSLKELSENKEAKFFRCMYTVWSFRND